MDRVKCVRKLWFCCGHRILGHEHKCANVHGHNYTAFISAEADQLDAIGRIVDFSVLKEKVGDWIDQYWDHTFIMYDQDAELIAIKEKLSINKEVFVAEFNPTAENLASHLLNKVCPLVLKGTGVHVSQIELWESENNKVIVSKEY